MSLLLLLLLVAGGGAVFYIISRRRAGTSPLDERMTRYGLAPQAAPLTVPGVPGGEPAPIDVGRPQGRITQAFDNVLRGSRLAANVTRRLERADLKLTATEFLAIALLVAVVPAFVGLTFFGNFGLILGLIFGVAAPWVFLSVRIGRRSNKFLTQLADVTQMMGNSLAAGFSIMQSMELVGREGPDPASHEFERATTEVKLGLPLDQALEHMLQRMPSEDLELMIVAINVQRQVGGNLAQVLAIISNTIRERVRFKGDLRSLTAQARFSSYIIAALPLAVAFMINLLDSQYESYLYLTSIGHLMIGVALLMMFVGFLILRKIADIEV